MQADTFMNNVIAHIKIRAVYEKEVLAMAANQDDEGHDHLGSHSLAFTQAYCEYQAGNIEIPELFQGIELLEYAWIDGQLQASDIEEMETCERCVVSKGDPCPIHG